MYTVKSPFGPGKVGCISHDLARYTRFEDCREKLMAPEGTTWQRFMGNGFAFGRNVILKELPKDAEWVFFLDDDMPFQPDILMKLLSRKVDIIQPLCITRKPPYYPYTYRWDTEEEAFTWIDWKDLKQRGIQEVDAVGTGGMLIRREVIDAVGTPESPWFEEGKTGPEHIGEDLWFCRKAQMAGFKVYVDLDNRIGHIGLHEMWPASQQDGEWSASMLLSHGVGVALPTEFGRNVIQEI